MANSVDPDQTLIWVCTVSPGVSVRKFRIIMVFRKTVLANSVDHSQTALEQSDQCLRCLPYLLHFCILYKFYDNYSNFGCVRIFQALRYIPCIRVLLSLIFEAYHVI